MMYKICNKLAEEYTEALYLLITNELETQKEFTWALSGGQTPKRIFEILATDYGKKIPWNRIQVYWGDERCVPPDHEDSNYFMACQKLLCHVEIPRENIHRMKGEENPDGEALRYAEILEDNLPIIDDYPVFDLVMMGLGSDGHTASIFPCQEHLLTSERFCDTAVHPQTGQTRITLTGGVINSARFIHFIVGGKAKARVVSDIFSGKKVYPASGIRSEGNVTWFLDQDAASNLA